MDSFVSLLLAIAVCLGCLGTGRLVLSRARFRFQSSSEELVLAAGVGFGVLIYMMALLGLGRVYSPAVAWSLLGVIGILGACSLRTWRWCSVATTLAHQFRDLTKSWPLVLLLAIFLAYSIGYLLVSLTPTLDGDSIAGYLLTAREYAHQGGIVSVDYAYTDSLPANGQMLSTMGFLLRGQILAQLLVVWSMGILIVFAIYSFGRVWLSRRIALIAIVIWYGTGSVGFLAASGKIDLVWAAFDLLAIFAFTRWYFTEGSERDWKWLALTGFLLGVAGGTKQASLFTIIVIVVAIALRLIQDRKYTAIQWLRSYLSLGLPAAIAGVWVIRTFIMTGELGIYGEEFRGESGFLGFFRVLWQMSMLGNAVSTDGPVGKSIGPMIITAVPLLVLIRRVDRRIWHILAFCIAVMILWYFGVQRARHILPVLALLSLVAAYVIATTLANHRRIGQVAILLVCAALVLNLGSWSYINLVSLQRIPYVFGQQDLNGYLAHNLPKMQMYPNHTIVNYTIESLPIDARIAGAATGNSFYLNRPLYTDWHQTPETIPNPDDFASQLKASGITHVFINDAAIGRVASKEDWLLQQSFHTRYLTELVCANQQCLYSLNDTPHEIEEGHDS